MTQANWSDDRVEQLKTLWTEGLSCSQIARALGGVTRNAVIGKVTRLGLARRAMPPRINRPRLPSAPRLLSAKRLGKMAEGLYGPPMKPLGWESELEAMILETGARATVLT